MIPELSAVRVLAELAPPTGLAVSSHTSTQIVIGWTNGAGGHVIDVFRDSTLLTTLAAGTTSYTDNAVSAGTGYIYRVRHSATGAYSPPALVVGFTSLPVPISFTVSADGVNNAYLAWVNTDAAVSVNIYRNGSLLTNVDPGVDNYEDTSITADGTYTYKLSHYSDPDESGFTPNQSITIAARPSDPTGLGATTISNSEIDLAWTNPDSGASGEILRGASSNPTTQIATVGAGVASYHDTSCAAGTTYHYRVRQNKNGYESNYSSDVSATTAAGPDGPPTALAVATPYTDEAVLTWTTGDSDATTEVWRATSGSYTLIHTVTAGTNTYTDDTVAGGTTYHWKLRHVKNSLDSAYTSVVTKAQPAPGITSAGISATIGDSKFTMTWSAAAVVPRGTFHYVMAGWTDTDGNSNSTPANITSPHDETVPYTVAAKNPGVTHEVDTTVTFEIKDSSGSVVFTDSTTFRLTTYSSGDA